MSGSTGPNAHDPSSRIHVHQTSGNPSDDKMVIKRRSNIQDESCSVELRRRPKLDNRTWGVTSETKSAVGGSIQPQREYFVASPSSAHHKVLS